MKLMAACGVNGNGKVVWRCTQHTLSVQWVVADCAGGGMPSLLLTEDLYGRTGQCVDGTRCGLLGEVASSYENLFFICCS